MSWWHISPNISYQHFSYQLSLKVLHIRILYIFGPRYQSSVSLPHPLPPSPTSIIMRYIFFKQQPNIDCWLGRRVVFQGIRTSIDKKTIFCDFSWPPPLDPHTLKAQILCWKRPVHWFYTFLMAWNTMTLKQRSARVLRNIAC